MPKPTGVHRLVSLHRRGVFTDREAVARIIDLAAERDPAELVAHLPSDLLTGVRQSVAEAPTTEEGWSGMIHIWGGTFTTAPDYDPEAEQARLRAVHRAGVESFRSYFGRATADA